MRTAPPLRALSALPDNAAEPGITPLIHAEITDPLHEPNWDQWISAHQEATIFHTSAWARVLVETYGHLPRYLRLVANNQPIALIPMMEVRTSLTPARGICLPFTDYCAPLRLTSFGSALIISKLRQLARERCWRYFELRDASLLPEGAGVAESYFGHILDLTAGAGILESNYSPAVGRALRKAQRHRLVASICTSAEATCQFYRLHVRTRRKHGVPPQPFAFFRNIHKYIIEPGNGFVVLVTSGETPVAAAMFFKFGSQAIYKFGASDERWQQLRGNNVAIAEGIKCLCASGVESLHFGRTDRANDGLRRFKLSWGTREHEICYGKYSVSADTWTEGHKPSSTLHNRVFRNLPAPVNRLAGALLYPYLD
ncbi:MAG: GNAT family N-acetyltransferase [Verrucomicrobia bacterium]|nr:GNAT family N-acetyltransferase [Verrucomicrobiota bacterium]